jgi:hypothetical protein
VKDAAGNGPRPSGAGGGAIAQIGESGGARATRCGRVATGPGGQQRGAGGREESEAA